MTETIWTPAVRHFLYESLVAQFGPYSTWEKTQSPGKGQDAAYVAFCDAFAAIIGAKSGRAVSHQIMFSLPLTGDRDLTANNGLSRSLFLNMAAGFEAGFVDNSAFPLVFAAPDRAPKKKNPTRAAFIRNLILAGGKSDVEILDETTAAFGKKTPGNAVAHYRAEMIARGQLEVPHPQAG